MAAHVLMVLLYVSRLGLQLEPLAELAESSHVLECGRERGPEKLLGRDPYLLLAE